MAKETFVLTLPLKVEKWQADILDKRYELLRQTYKYGATEIGTSVHLLRSTERI